MLLVYFPYGFTFSLQGIPVVDFFQLHFQLVVFGQIVQTFDLQIHMLEFFTAGPEVRAPGTWSLSHTAVDVISLDSSTLMALVVPGCSALLPPAEINQILRDQVAFNNTENYC